MKNNRTNRKKAKMFLKSRLGKVNPKRVHAKKSVWSALTVAMHDTILKYGLSKDAFSLLSE